MKITKLSNLTKRVRRFLLLLLIVILVVKKGEVSKAEISKTEIDENQLNSYFTSFSKQINRSKLVKQHQSDESIETCASIVFGKYEIDGNLSNGLEDIEWVLLDYDEEKKVALLLSKYILDCKAYFDHIYVFQKNYDEIRNVYTADQLNSWVADENELQNLIFSRFGEYLKDLTWENSTLREWLNLEFYETCFNKYEKSIIKLTDINTIFKNDNNVTEVNTKDNVFCLDLKDLKEYMHYDTNSGAKNVLAGTSATQFAKMVSNFDDGIKVEKDSWYKGMSNYWLRTRNKYGDPSTAKVMLPIIHPLNLFGEKRENFDYASVDKRNIGVRPAIFVDLNLETVKERSTTISDNSDNKIIFDKRMFKIDKSNNVKETTISDENVERYYSGGKW